MTLSQNLLWPIWWYTTGFVWFLKTNSRFIRGQARILHLGVWIRYLFVPMFGAKDRASRIISFFIRIFEIIIRGLVLLIFCLLSFIVIIIYLLIPILIIYLLINQFT
jgi:hypothetical protein